MRMKLYLVTLIGLASSAFALGEDTPPPTVKPTTVYGCVAEPMSVSVENFGDGDTIFLFLPNATSVYKTIDLKNDTKGGKFFSLDSAFLQNPANFNKTYYVVAGNSQSPPAKAEGDAPQLSIVPPVVFGGTPASMLALHGALNVNVTGLEDNGTPSFVFYWSKGASRGIELLNAAANQTAGSYDLSFRQDAFQGETSSIGGMLFVVSPDAALSGGARALNLESAEAGAVNSRYTACYQNQDIQQRYAARYRQLTVLPAASLTIEAAAKTVYVSGDSVTVPIKATSIKTIKDASSNEIPFTSDILTLPRALVSTPTPQANPITLTVEGYGITLDPIKITVVNPSNPVKLALAGTNIGGDAGSFKVKLTPSLDALVPNGERPRPLTVALTPAFKLDNDVKNWPDGSADSRVLPNPTLQTTEITVPKNATTLATQDVTLPTVAGTYSVKGDVKVKDTDGLIETVQGSVGIPVLAPVISEVILKDSTLVINGYTTTRDLTSVEVKFTEASGTKCSSCGTYLPPLDLTKDTYFSTPENLPYGGSFNLTIPITLNSSNNGALKSATVRITNSKGVSEEKSTSQ